MLGQIAVRAIGKAALPACRTAAFAIVDAAHIAAQRSRAHRIMLSLLVMWAIRIKVGSLYARTHLISTCLLYYTYRAPWLLE